MNLAFFVAQYPVLSETFIIRQIAGQIARGHKVTILTGKLDNNTPDPLNGKAEIVILRVKGTKLKILARIVIFLLVSLFRKATFKIALFAYKELIKGRFTPLADFSLATSSYYGNFDSIIAHFGPAGVRAYELRKNGYLCGPLAVVFHGLDMSVHKIVAANIKKYKILFRNNITCLPVSEFWRHRLLSWGADPKNTHVIHMGIDIKNGIEPNFNRPISTPMRILTVARLTEKKGIEYTIESVKKAPFPIILNIIGAGPLEAHLKNIAKDSTNEINFLGKQPHDQIFNWLQKSDVFMLPSVTPESGDMEGIPVSLMEAMASGVIVVSTNHSGIPELVENGVSGFLANERDSSELASILIRINNKDSNFTLLRREAFNKICTDFNNEILDSRLEALIRKMQ